MATNKIVCLILCLMVPTGLAAKDVPEKITSEGSSPRTLNDTDEASSAAQQLIAAYTQEIERHEQENGAYDAAMAESLFGLGKALQSAGEHRRAIEYFKQVRHINKVNNGLFSLTQEPMLRESITSHSVLGDWEATARDFDTLYLISERTYGEHDPRMIPVLDELAQWHLNAFREQKKADANHLVVSRNLSNRAISLIQRHVDDGDLRLVELLRFQALASFYLAQMLGFQDGLSSLRSNEQNRESLLEEKREKTLIVGNSYRDGKRSYEKLIEVLYNNPESTTLDRASAYAELGDWFLLFNRRDSAKKAYSDALALSGDLDEKASMEKRLFGVVRLLPVSAPKNKFSQSDKRSGPLVELKLKTNRYGYARVKEIVSISPEPVNRKIMNRKIKQIMRANRFRPDFKDGQLLTRNDVTFKFRLEDD